MFGLQASELKQTLRDVDPRLDGLAETLGDCEAPIEHAGPMRLGGPITVGDGQYWPDGEQFIDAPNKTIFARYLGGGGSLRVAFIRMFFREGVLTEDLTRDGEAVMNEIDPTTDAVYSPNRTLTVHGRYVLTGKKISSGARIGAMWNGFRWRAKVTDVCVVDA